MSDIDLLTVRNSSSLREKREKQFKQNQFGFTSMATDIELACLDLALSHFVYKKTSWTSKFYYHKENKIQTSLSMLRRSLYVD